MGANPARSDSTARSRGVTLNKDVDLNDFCLDYHLILYSFVIMVSSHSHFGRLLPFWLAGLLIRSDIRNPCCDRQFIRIPKHHRFLFVSRTLVMHKTSKASCSCAKLDGHMHHARSPFLSEGVILRAISGFVLVHVLQLLHILEEFFLKLLFLVE